MKIPGATSEPFRKGIERLLVIEESVELFANIRGVNHASRCSLCLIAYGAAEALELLHQLPLDERVAFGMIFEDRFYLGVKWNLGHRIADQVSNHADIVGVGEFHQHDQ